MDELQIADYKLRFCAAIVPIEPGMKPEDVVAPALKMVSFAKNHSASRLIVQFEARSAARTLLDRKAEIDRELKGIDELMSSNHQANMSQDPDQEARRLQVLKNQKSELEAQGAMLARWAPQFAR